MIDLSTEQKALLLSNSVKKTWTFEVFDGSTSLGHIPTSKMVANSFSIKEPVCSAQTIFYGSCEAAVLSIKVADIDYSLKGKRLVLSLSATDGTTSVDMNIGTFYVDEYSNQNGTYFYTVTAYDGMSLFDTDVSDWYKNLSFPMSMYAFRCSLCAHLGVTQVLTSLPCDAMQIDRTVEPDKLLGRDVLKAICQLNACFGHFNRSGELSYLYLGNSSVLTLSKGGADFYKTSAKHENWSVAAYDAVTIQPDENSIGVTFPIYGGDNILKVKGNFLTYGMNNDQLGFIAESVYSKATGISYVVHSTPTQGRPWIEAGDKITISNEQGGVISAFDTYVLERTLSGFQGFSDTYSANGSEETDSEFSSATQIEQLKQKTNSITRTVNETVSKVEDLDNEVTEIKQTAGQVSVTVRGENGTLETVINGTSWGATFTDNNGNVQSGLTFDFQHSQFIFNGAGKFTGQINVNDNFVVTEAGDVTLKGSTYIYGGRYYAGDDENGGFTTMDATGFNVYNADAIQRIKIGFSANNSDCPYVLLNSGENNTDVAGLFKKFVNGLWIGNSAPREATGAFVARSGYLGIFVSFEDAKTYVVDGTNMQNVYTGEAIAKFG